MPVLVARISLQANKRRSLVNASRGQADSSPQRSRICGQGLEGSISAGVRRSWSLVGEGACCRKREAMQEVAPGVFELQRRRLNFFAWNAGHLMRSGSEPFSGARTRSLLVEYLFSVHCQILLLQEANFLDAVSQSYARAQVEGAVLRRDPHFALKKEDAAAVLGKLVHDRLNALDITVIKDPDVPDLAIVQRGVAVRKRQVVSARGFHGLERRSLLLFIFSWQPLPMDTSGRMCGLLRCAAMWC